VRYETNCTSSDMTNYLHTYGRDCALWKSPQLRIILKRFRRFPSTPPDTCRHCHVPILAASMQANVCRRNGGTIFYDVQEIDLFTKPRVRLSISLDCVLVNVKTHIRLAYIRLLLFKSTSRVVYYTDADAARAVVDVSIHFSITDAEFGPCRGRYFFREIASLLQEASIRIVKKMYPLSTSFDESFLVSCWHSSSVCLASWPAGL
jgi:hypothetical protein